MKLGYPLQTVELTREHYEIALQEALELYTKFASFDVEDIVVSLEKYDPKCGLDLSEYKIADIHDISFRRDAFLQLWGCDFIFGPYGMMNSYAGQGIFPGGNGAGIGNQGWVSLHNLHEFIEMANRVTGSAPQWRFFRNSQRLKIIPTPKLGYPCKDSILITCECEPPVEELLGNEYVKKLLLAKCKIQLGDIRSSSQFSFLVEELWTRQSASRDRLSGTSSPRSSGLQRRTETFVYWESELYAMLKTWHLSRQILCKYH